jgi:hypothetical protein
MSNTITRTKAKQLTLVYQAAAGVCVLGAIALGVVGLPESATTAQINKVAESNKDTISSGVPGSDPGAESTPSNSTEQQYQVPVDAGSIAARLAMLDNAPKVTQAEPDTPDLIDTTPVVSSEQSPISKRVRYTGYIQDSERPLAFIRIDGVQRIVPQSGTARAGSLGFDDLTVKEVHPEYIILSDGQAQERIDLATNNGPAVTMASGAEVVVADVPTTLEDVVLSPEELAELARLPARKAAAREKMLRREKLGMPPERGNTRKPLASYSANFNDPSSSSVRRQPNESSSRSQEN